MYSLLFIRVLSRRADLVTEGVRQVLRQVRRQRRVAHGMIPLPPRDAFVGAEGRVRRAVALTWPVQLLVQIWSSAVSLFPAFDFVFPFPQGKGKTGGMGRRENEIECREKGKGLPLQI